MYGLFLPLQTLKFYDMGKRTDLTKEDCQNLTVLCIILCADISMRKLMFTCNSYVAIQLVKQTLLTGGDAA
jgi:hypothetical protein